MDALSFDVRDSTYPDPVPTPWKMCVQLRVKDPSLPLKDIARSLGYSQTTVYLWTKNPRYQRYEDWVLRKIEPNLTPLEREIREDVRLRVQEKFLSHSEEMQDRLLAILETVDDPKVQKEIAFEWLGHAGFTRPKDTAQRNFTVVISDELGREFLQRAQEAGLTRA